MWILSCWRPKFEGMMAANYEKEDEGVQKFQKKNKNPFFVGTTYE